MSLSVWIGVFLFCSLFWAWLIFWGGANWLERTWLIAIVVDAGAIDWTAEGIRFFAMLVWILQTIWFVIGLFVPSARLWL